MTTSTQTQLRRGTHAQVVAMTPATGEVVVDTTNKRIYLGDGATAGGIPLANAADAQLQTFNYSTVGGTGDAITLTNVPAVAALVSGLRLKFKATSDNTTAITLAVDGLAAKNGKYMLDGALAAIPAAGIKSGGIYEAIYDGTQFQIFGIGVTTPSTGALKYLGKVTASNSASIALTSLLSSTYDDYIIELSGVLPISSGVGLRLETSSNNGSSYLSSAYNYCRSVLAGTTQTNVNPGDSSIITLTASNIYNDIRYGSLGGKINLFNVNNASTANPMIEWSVGYNADNAGNMAMARGWGTINRGAVTSINAARFTATSGNISKGDFLVYAIQKS